MYETMKKFILRFLRVPLEPEDPMGDVDSLLVFRASWNFFRYRFMLWCFTNTFALLSTLVVPVVGLWALHESMQKKGHDFPLSATLFIIILAGIILYAILQIIISYLALRLDYELRWYKVSDRSLRIREGVFNVREMTMTFANIQNIEIIQGPIQRLFGIADLKVETAGGGGGTLANRSQSTNQTFFSFHIAYFRGIENAIEIRDLMRSRLEKIRSTGLGDESDPAVPESPSVTDKTLFSPDCLEMLREIKNEATGLRQAAAAS